MSVEVSNTLKSLKGKPFGNSTISTILKMGDRRIVVTANGSTTLTKDELYKLLQDTKAPEQKAAMAKTMHQNADGTVSMCLGGTKRGKLKTYKTISGARRALTRCYGK